MVSLRSTRTEPTTRPGRIGDHFLGDIAFPIKIAIVGSRKFDRLHLVSEFVVTLPADATVISGGAGGVDQAAEAAARASGLAVLIFDADWARHGRAAGPIRNVEIVEAADELIAFWEGESRGTLNSVALAARRGIPVRVLGPNGIDLRSAT